MPKRVVTGIVTRDKAAKTRRIEVTRLVRHPRYGKILRRRTVCTAHDEENQSHAGDLVEIEESRPLSRTKRWKLLRVVTEGPAHGRNVAARRRKPTATATPGERGRCGRDAARSLSKTETLGRSSGNPRANGTSEP